MPTPRRKAALWTTVALLAFAVAGLAAWWRLSRVPVATADLLRRLPTEDAVVVGIDFETLRRAGFLHQFFESHAAPEAEYAAFLRDTGFDYQRDLDYVLASFAPDGEFFLARGNFDWSRLERFAAAQGGACADHLCRLTGSTPEKRISFTPIARHVLALAVSTTDDTAVARLEYARPADLKTASDVDVSPEPVWLSLTSGALRHSTSLPGSTRLFASAIGDAHRVSLTLGPSGSDIEARLVAICQNERQAGALIAQLRGFAGLLRSEAQREGKPLDGKDLGSLLASGTFDQAGSHVLGRWHLNRSFLDNLGGT